MIYLTNQKENIEVSQTLFEVSKKEWNLPTLYVKNREKKTDEMLCKSLGHKKTDGQPKTDHQAFCSCKSRTELGAEVCVCREREREYVAVHCD